MFKIKEESLKVIENGFRNMLEKGEKNQESPLEIILAISVAFMALLYKSLSNNRKDTEEYLKLVLEIVEGLDPKEQ